ncbi:MAG: Tfp pilus assembly protein FimT/FimU [Bacteroidota bacterium]
MPISGIGNQKALPESGYTLIEILAVLVILSVIGLLAFPRYERGEEKAYLKQIGNLVRADLRTVSEEAVCEKSDILVEFFTNGYRFDIGDKEIRRVFDKFRFHWDVPVEEIEEAEGEAIVETLGLPGGEEEEINYGSIELSFYSDGIYPDLIVDWSSQNYTGSLIIESDGSVDWVSNFSR